MYSYGASARGAAGKRGHGGRPYRAPPNRSGQPAKPPPLKACDCLVELDIPEYIQQEPSSSSSSPAVSQNAASSVAAQSATATTTPPPRAHAAFGGRDAMEATVRYIRSHFLCHLQVPGRRQHGRPVVLVAVTVWDALPACHYLMRQLAIAHDTLTVRIHPNVKQNLPVIHGSLHKVTAPFGCLLDSDTWIVAVVSDLVTLQDIWQTCLDNLAFADASCQFQVHTEVDHGYAFALGSRVNVDTLLAAMVAATSRNP